jgi:hypothetical protein
MSRTFYGALADVLLAIHFAFVLFVVLGLLMIWMGGLFRWRLVRSFAFRAAHVAAIGVVAAESVAGITCPLTTWENDLRLLAGGGGPYAGSFVQYWIHRAMFFEASEMTFTLIYLLFFGGVILSFWLVPPRWPARWWRPFQKAQTRA